MEVTKSGQLDMIKLLVKFGADPGIPDNDGITCLSLAYMHPEILGAFLQTFATASIENARAKKKEAKEENGGCLWNCAGCGSSDKDNNRCTACYLVWYCGKECQENEWENHKNACK